MVKNKVREVRRMADESQDELAEAIGVSRQTVHSIEHNKRDVSGETMLKIARHYGKSVEEIFLLNVSTIVDK